MAGLLLIFRSNLGRIILKVFARMGTHSGIRLVTFIGILVGLSFICDVLFLGFIRWMVRRMSEVTSLFQLVGFLAMISIIAFGLVAAPLGWW